MKKHPVVISIPHASLFVPQDIRGKMLIGDRDIKNHADLHTDEIYSVKNAHIIKAKISRLVVDVNRAPDDIETECRLQADGVVVRTTPDGNIIYGSPPSLKQISQRIETYHDTFHRDLSDMIDQSSAKFLIDGHSMWSLGPSALKDAGEQRADICLGNRDYTTCSQSQTNFIKNFFQSQGFRVEINTPYRGKYTLGFHCHRNRLPGIQIELNRSLYLNEKTLSPKKTMIAKLHTLITELVEQIEEKF